jgi:hypothetical protein
MSDEQPPFYLVWNPVGFPPRYKHTTQASAEIEAQRLAELDQGNEYFVLAPISATKRVSFMRRTFDLSSVAEDIPF